MFHLFEIKFILTSYFLYLILLVFEFNSTNSFYLSLFQIPLIITLNIFNLSYLLIYAVATLFALL